MPDAWRNLLRDLSEELLRDEQILLILKHSGTLKQALESRWSGSKSASDSDILALEKRLGANLPQSYRTFLLTTNGFGAINRSTFRLLAANELSWCSDFIPPLITGWLAGEKDNPSRPIPDSDYFTYGQAQDPCDIRPEYLLRCLQISEMGDAELILLNPVIQGNDGEWEAWRFNVKFAGAYRYRSFYELMQAQLDLARDIASQT